MSGSFSISLATINSSTMLVSYLVLEPMCECEGVLLKFLLSKARLSIQITLPVEMYRFYTLVTVK